MSSWLIVSVLLLIGWVWHVQHLYERQRKKNIELKTLQAEQKELQSTLSNQDLRLDVLFSSVNEVVMRIDNTGRIVTANTRAKKIFAIHHAPSLPQSMLLFYREPDWQRQFSKSLKKLPTATSLPDMHINGRVLAPRLVPLNKAQALLLCMDITEKHQAELQQKNLFSNLMHDLKTPLTSLLGYARSLESFGDDPAFRHEAAKVIGDESKHINALLETLLSLEQAEHPHNKDATCDAADVCKKVWQSLTTQLQSNHMQLALEIQEPCAISMSESDCYRIILNIAENAIRYSPKQTSITCTLNKNVLHIIDEGSGIPEQHLPRITERFYRIDASRQRGGHGLGLAITHELLQRDGGELKFQNRDDIGLDVQVIFPV